MHLGHLGVHYLQHFIDDLAASSRSGSPLDSSVQLEGLNKPPHANSADVNAIFLHLSAVLSGLCSSLRVLAICHHTCSLTIYSRDQNVQTFNRGEWLNCQYSKPSLIQTALYQVVKKCVPISEFVPITETLHCSLCAC